MAQTIPQAILDSLTDVPLPHAMPEGIPQRTLTLGATTVPVFGCEALVVGSGAAGLRAAVELKRRGVDVLVATQTLFWGTSACSGSDKQTLHTAATSRRGDDFTKLATALGAGGAMDHDTAYVEAVGSIEAFGGLKYLGLPLPEDRFGAVLRYQTDHDEAGRATSCGPRTSRLMVKVLAEEALRLAVPFVNRATAVRLLLADADDGGQRVVGLLAANAEAREAHNPFGLQVFLSPAVVLATGGPGELYRDSVYPKHCFGALGVALEASVEAVNLAESQFGVGTRREDFPWNLSGTYMQSMPYIYSVDATGAEHNFLADYYRSTQELASNIFRKGYQWPFHATRLLDFGSSLLDLAIFRESQQGRTVMMDFQRNPQPVPGDQAFSLDRLDEDVRQYLANNDALLESPIHRLRHMNPLAIELYKRYKHDLTAAPLPFNVNNQHMNGGLAVSIWGETSLAGCYAIGEMAGTHGVTRPGGAALNAGQVFGLRCAKHIHAQSRRLPSDCTAPVTDALTRCLRVMQDDLHAEQGLDIEEVHRTVQALMSDHAGFVCQVDQVPGALEQARALNAALRTRGIRTTNAVQAVNAMLWRQMALTAEAVLTTLHHYIENGGGSRGARVLCSPKGSEVPATRQGPLEAFRFLPENPADRAVQLRVRLHTAGFAVRALALRTLDDLDDIYFEKNWPDFLTGKVYGEPTP